MAVAESKKTPAERNKMIAAIVLGAIALISLAYMFLGSSSSKSTTTTTTTKASPTPVVRTSPALPAGKIPTEDYVPRIIPTDWPKPAIPEADRNIFAFYEPPPPTPKPITTPTPIPTPPPPQPNLILASISPVNVYAHTGDFNLDVTGDKFTPETYIYIGGAEIQTRFVSPQQLSAKVPAQLISFEGGREVKVQSRDGKLFSNTATLNVMPAPVPNYTYIGVINRTGSNDIAIFKEKNGKDLMNVQRGDIVGGRFRVTSISVREVTLVDTALKIKHTLPLVGDNSNPSAPRYTPPPPSEEGGDAEP
jgi:hypothetical protein